MPPPAISSLMNMVPRSALTFFKNWFHNQKLIISDTYFQLSTKYTTAFAIVILCICASNEWYSYQDIICHSTLNSDANEAFNEYCWTHGTFLVTKYLDPAWKGKVPQPGIGAYLPGNDDIITQTYYNHMWLILIFTGIANYIPYFFWKGVAVRKLLDITRSDISSSDRAVILNDTLGLTTCFSFHYPLFKLLSSVMVVGSAAYVNHLIPGFHSYGYVQLIASAKGTWPLPRDVVFPKSAKCNMAYYGESGDMQTTSGVCSLPLNVLSQWTFLYLWWHLIAVFVMNCVSTLCLMYYKVTPSERNLSFKKLCLRIFRNMKDNDFRVDISFGDFIFMQMLQSNMSDREFSEMVIELVTEHRQNILILTLAGANSVIHTSTVSHSQMAAETQNTVSVRSDNCFLCVAQTCAAIE